MRKVLLLLLLALLVAGAERPKISAAYQRQEGDRLIAEGDVEVRVGKLRVLADRLIFYLKQEKLVFEGNVSIFTEKGFLTGSQVEYNLKTSYLKVKDAWGRFEPGVIIQAQEIEGKEQKVFSFVNGKFTPCVQPCPYWQVRVKKGRLIKDDHVSIWGALLQIKGLPVLYLPYFYYPLPKHRRKTGFLMPHVGYNSFKGYIVGEDFFWAPARWIDFTLSAQYMSNVGALYSAEYRYILNEGNHGQVRFSIIKNRNTGTTDYLLRGQEIHNLGKGWRLEGKFDLVSSYEFLKNYSNDYNRSTQRIFYSVLYLTKSWTGINFSLKLDEQRSFFSDIKRTFRHLPELSLTISRKKLSRSLPFYLSSRILAGTISSCRGEDCTGLSRLVLRPSLSFPLPLAPWLTLEGNYSLNLNIYSDSYLEGLSQPSGQPLSVLQNVLTLTLTGPVVYRIYETPWLRYSPKFKHVIEPVISLHYAPEVEEAARIIRYDRYDRLYYTSRISFSLNNRLLAKKKIGKQRSPVEILTFTLSGNYYFDPEKELGGVKKLGQTPYFSTLSYYLRFAPQPYASFYLRGEYDPYYRTFLYRTVSLSLRSKQWPITLNLNYAWQKYVSDAEERVSRSFLRIGGMLRLKPLGLRIRGSADYNFLTHQLQQYTIFAVYDLQCIAIVFYYTYMPFREREHQFSFSIMLPQVGFSSDKLGGMR